MNDYSYFVYLVNRNLKSGVALEQAIEEAIKQSIEENRLQEFLKTHGSEVINMLTTEFNLEDAKTVWQEEALEKGRVEGQMKERIKIAISLLGLLSDEIIAEKAGLSMEEIAQLKK